MNADDVEVIKQTGLSEDELISMIGEFDALLVRSQTTVTERVMEAGVKLKVIGRAGVGVDNIDLDAATNQGIVVINAPDGKDRKSTRLNSSHVAISYAVFCLKKNKVEKNYVQQP